MHESTGRTSNSSSSLLLSSNSHRALNIHPPKLTRTLQQDNASKKIKISHTNGVKPTVDGNSVARSKSFLSRLSKTKVSRSLKAQKVIIRYDVPYDKLYQSLNNLLHTIQSSATKSKRKLSIQTIQQRRLTVANRVRKPNHGNYSGKNAFKTFGPSISMKNLSNT